MRNIIRITRNHIEGVNLDAEFDQTLFKQVCTGLSGVFCDNDTSDKKSTFFERVDQTQYIGIVSDAEVAADFIFFNIHRTDDDDDLCVLGQLHQKLKLGIRLKSRQYTGSVVVIK